MLVTKSYQATQSRSHYIVSRKLFKCSLDVNCMLFKTFCFKMYYTAAAMKTLRIFYKNNLQKLLTTLYSKTL